MARHCCTCGITSVCQFYRSFLVLIQYIGDNGHTKLILILSSFSCCTSAHHSEIQDFCDSFSVKQKPFWSCKFALSQKLYTFSIGKFSHVTIFTTHTSLLFSTSYMAYLSFNKLLPSVNTVVKTANQLAQVMLVKQRPDKHTSNVSRQREESFTKQYCVEATVIKIEFQLCLS